MSTAAEATIGSDKAYLLRDPKDSSIVISSVVEHKIANSTRVNTKLLQSFANNLCNLLASISAC
jgi:hypothetical protein